MKILITGAGGYIGSITAYLFLQKGFEVIALDNFTTGFKEPLQLLQRKFGKSKLRFYEIDITEDLNTILDKEDRITGVIHFAGSCLIDDSINNPQKYFQNNICGSQNLLLAMLKHNIKNIIFSSTCAVYGNIIDTPVTESHPINPINPYGESKKIVEDIIRWYHRLLGLNYVILRYFNVCGASKDGLFGDSKKPSPHLIQNAVRASLGISNFSLTCPQVKTPDKTPIRDYINVVDLAEAHIKALKYLFKGGKSDTFNLGTGKGSSVKEVIKTVQDITGVKFDTRDTAPRKGEYAKMIASIKKAKDILNWQPRKTLSNSIKSLLKWYGKNPQGWNN